MEEVKINELGIKVGDKVRKRFNHFKNKFDAVGDVRGLGAMLAIELIKNNDPSDPDSELAANLIKVCEEKGLIIISAGTFGNCIRILSPLTIPDELLEKGLDILEESIAQLTK